MNRGKHTRLSRTAAGFTIVEVLIVLAIAGLILLIVLLAIPTLERSSRNNQRKQDVTSILGAISDWELNNSGNIPDPSAGDDFYSYLKKYAKLTYYVPPTSSNIKIKTRAAIAGHGPALPTSLDEVDVYNHQKCSADTPGTSTGDGASYGDIVALFNIESGNSNPSHQCQQL